MKYQFYCYLLQTIYAPVNAKPHLPQVGQRVGISRGLSLKIVPGVGAFVKHKKCSLDL